jgi:heterodisulfide reductase subunit A-like polyferredoxin
MHAHQNGTPMLASWGYIASVDTDLCGGCETCAEHCQFAAISLVREPGKGEPLEIQKVIAHAAQLR